MTSEDAEHGFLTVELVTLCMLILRREQPKDALTERIARIDAARLPRLTEFIVGVLTGAIETVAQDLGMSFEHLTSILAIVSQSGAGE